MPTPKKPPTRMMDKQSLEEMYEFICQYRERHGESPSCIEIGLALHWSKPSVRSMVDRMAEMGWLSKRKNANRGIIPARPLTDVCEHCGGRKPMEKNPRRRVRHATSWW